MGVRPSDVITYVCGVQNYVIMSVPKTFIIHCMKVYLVAYMVKTMYVVEFVNKFNENVY
jgi:hypothetical protein